MTKLTICWLKWQCWENEGSDQFQPPQSLSTRDTIWWWWWQSPIATTTEPNLSTLSTLCPRSSNPSKTTWRIITVMMIIFVAIKNEAKMMLSCWWWYLTKPERPQARTKLSLALADDEDDVRLEINWVKLLFLASTLVQPIADLMSSPSHWFLTMAWVTINH